MCVVAVSRKTEGLGYGSSTCFSLCIFSGSHAAASPNIYPLLFTFFTPRNPTSSPSQFLLPFFLNVHSLILAMEIDFMGLYSQNPAAGPVQNSYEPYDQFVDSGIGSGEGNVSLSLCTSSPMEEIAVFRDFPRKKTRKSSAENMTTMRNWACNYDWENAQPRERSCQSFVGKPVIGHSGFLYNRDDRLPISRNKFERRPLSFPASSTIFCPADAPIFFPAQKADRKVYAIGDASFDDTRKSKDGYIPTVAMARKATLARFLEKRSHRLNQQIKPHLMGRSLNWPEACDTTFKKCNKKIKSSMQYEVLM